MRSMAKKPCCARTRPWPPQVLQVTGFEPARAPEPRAGFASDRSRHADRRGLAVKRLFKRDLEVIAKVRAALSAPGLTTASPAAHHVAEQVIENIGHRRRKAVAHAALIEGRMAVAVVGRALLSVRQMLIGFVELLEPRLGLLVAGMPIGVALHGRLAEGGLQFGVARRFGNAQSFIKIALGHLQRARSLCMPRPTHATPRFKRADPIPDAEADDVTADPQSGRSPPPSRRPPKSTGRCSAAGFIRQDFFLSSSTSRNSASITSSLASAPASAPPRPALRSPVGPYTWPRQVSFAPA